ncbi:phage holin family protein [Sphingomonas sp. CL5.1]|uniref:phage holin family protein n=1 Tax=Sphingomonas sp. CL5.1 TaxID=2653203 RepID=UPI001582EFDF|nr:phage holin family protein [Sphingomonas sp. CL5.1]QKS00740.1 phage holin family protein [Sphingomonas sp. CL5.1]
MAEGDRPTVDEGIAALVGQLADDAREVASAEIGLVKARVTTSITRFRDAAILFAAAIVLALAALVALLVGLIEALAPHTGPGVATAIVCGVVLLIAAILALFGKNRLERR